jgi:hypothetical protein
LAAVEANPLAALAQPFPGLRPFETREAYLFRGRQQHTAELLARLGGNRFLAVVGNSGSGKSSLVRGGLLPALYRGYLSGATSRWRVAVMRPGVAPLEELAKALSGEQALGPEGDAQRRALLHQTSMGCIRAVEAARLPKGESLLIVVDQFEELFRFERESGSKDAGAEAALFVRELLAAVDEFGVPIYVVLTMRSDYLGDCSRFPGLPEALNRSQYLVPRLTREQRREVIEEPAALVGATVAPRLIQRVLNDAGDDPDQLPVLQHALTRTYFRWKSDGAKGSIDLEHYEKIGGIRGALDSHANSILESLDEASRRCAPQVFRCLTTAESGRDVRRPARIERIYEVTGAADDASRRAVDAVVAAFSAREHSLLVCTGGPGVRSESVVDISHESLIRGWALLAGWVKDESKNAEWYRDLAADVERYAAGEKGLWRDPDLAHALWLQSENRWNAAWAAQYWPPEQRPSYADVQSFLAESWRVQNEARERENARRLKEIEDARALAAARKRGAWWLAGAAVLLFLLLAAVVTSVAIHERDDANTERERKLRIAAEERLINLSGKADELKQQIGNLEGTLRASGHTPAEQKAIEEHLDHYKQEYERTLADAAKARTQLSSAAATAKAQDPSAAQVQDLLAQLKVARDERDRYQAMVQKSQPPVEAKAPAFPPETVRRIQAIVNALDTGDAAPPYGAVERAGDLFYGRSRHALSSGSLYSLIARYEGDGKALYGKAFTPYLSRIQSRDEALTRDPVFLDLLRKAGGDPVMQALQDRYFENTVWQPALSSAANLGIRSPLGVAVVLDSVLNSAMQGAFSTLRDRATAALGGTPATGLDEHAWIRAYVAERGNVSGTKPVAYRVDAFQQLIAQGQWELSPPLTVRGVRIE